MYKHKWFQCDFGCLFLFLDEHPCLVPQTFSFPHKHIHLLVPEAVGHVMHSLFCALLLLLDRICVVPFKSTHCVLQNSHLKCINQCLGNLFILVLVLGGKFLLSYYKFSLNYLKHFFFFDILEKECRFSCASPKQWQCVILADCVCSSAFSCYMTICTSFFRPAYEPFSPSARQQNKQKGVICNGANHFTPGGAKTAWKQAEQKAAWEWPTVTPQGFWMGLIKQRTPSWV